MIAYRNGLIEHGSSSALVLEAGEPFAVTPIVHAVIETGAVRLVIEVSRSNAFESR